MDNKIISETGFPIDAVILWVDGSDPRHVAKLNAHLLGLGGKRPKAARPERFHNAGELDYCVTSILKFAPWIRTIHIVTDQQIPKFMDLLSGTAYEDRVKIIDHQVIFAGFEDCLPTFNSNSISSLLYRIPDLAEHFIFFNDDFALIRPVYPDDFFRKNSVVLRGRWHRLSEYLPHKRLIQGLKKIGILRADPEKERTGYREGQQVSAKLLGFSPKYFRLPHNPHAWRVSTHREFFEQHPELLRENVRYQLRSPRQFVVEAFSAHLEIQKNTAIVDNRRSNVQLKPAEQSLWRIKKKIAESEKSVDLIFTCVQSIETASPEKQRIIFEWLDRRIGKLQDCLSAKVLE